MKNIILLMLISVSCFAQTRTTLTYEANDSIEFVSVLTFDRQKLPRLELKPNETREYHFLKGQNFFPVVVTAPSDPNKTYYIEYTLREEGVIIEPDPDVPSILGSIDNVDPRNKYTGDWTPFNHSVFHNRTSVYTLVNGVVEITFIGKKIEWWTEKAVNHGIVALSIDDGAETMVDLYANTTVNNAQKVWTSPSLAPGEHKLKIRFTGNKNPLSSQANFIHDRILVIE